MTNVTTTLTLNKECKSSARFDSKNSDEKVCANIYLNNESYEALGKPKQVVITVEAAK